MAEHQDAGVQARRASRNPKSPQFPEAAKLGASFSLMSRLALPAGAC